MKNIMSLTVLLASIILSGCNKGGTFADARIKKITSGRGESEYAYSADNKVQSVKNANGSKTAYTYKDKTITQVTGDSIRGMFLTSNIFLNAAGLVDSSVATDANGSYVELYTHDADGHITQLKEVISGKLYTATNSTFKDGNEYSRVITDSSLNPRVSVFFDYYTDKSNSTGFANTGMTFLGKDSKNLMKKFVQILPSGDTIRTLNFSYHFDDKGRVIQKVLYDNHGMMADSSIVTYY